MPPSCSARSARPEPVRYGRACQMLVQPTIGTRSHRPLEVWACPPSPSSPHTPHSGPNAPRAGPLLLQRTGDNPGPLTYRLHATPTTARRSATSARDLARCPSGAVWPQEPRGHVIVIRRLQTRRVYPILHSSTRHHNPGVWSGRTAVNVCALATGRNLSFFRAARWDIAHDVPPVTRTRLRAINSAQLTGVSCGSHVHIREFRNFNSLKAPLQASFWPSCFACALVRPALRLGCPWRTTTLVTDDATRVGHDRSPLLCRIGLSWTWTGLTAAV